MSNATSTATAVAAAPTYKLTVEPEVSSYYLSLFPTERPLKVHREEIRSCASLPFEGPMMVVDHFAGDMAAGIEILSPLKVEQAEERDGASAIEITLGHDDGSDLVTIENGITFDRSDEGRLAGIEVDYTLDGAVVAVRVDRAKVETNELL